MFYFSCNEKCFVDLIMFIKASMFCCLLSSKENNDKATSQSERALHQRPISSRLTRDYDETRLTNSSNVKLSISMHY
jgi:hypothetical protein